MKPPARETLGFDSEVIDWLYGNGQSHLFRFWPRLDEKQRRSLIEDLRGLSVARLKTLLAELERPNAESDANIDFQPMPILGIPRTEEERSRLREAQRVGLEALRAGEVAVYLVAGGQGSRLGFDGPKGCFPFTPISKRSLFELFAGKIAALEKRVGRKIPWVVMTSQENHKTTVDFFRRHGGWRYGLEGLEFISQEMWPSFSLEGKMLLESPSRLAMNPNGHGGSLAALEESGVAQRLQREGVRHLFYFQVDNPLVRIADPAFLGYHIEMGSSFSAKVVAKTDPDERVGVLGSVNGAPGVIEYSDLPDGLRNQRDEEGRLLYRAGNTAIHCLDLAFVRRTVAEGEGLPIHCARKAVSYLDDDGETVLPEKPNAIKMETFVFDAMKGADRVLAMEVDRNVEFAPIKNGEGNDSPATATRMSYEMHLDWLREAGYDGEAPERLEIAPCWADDQETFLARASELDWKSMAGQPDWRIGDEEEE